MLTTKQVNKYDTYKDSGIEWIGEIPKEWKFAKLAWCSNFINGYAFNSENMDIDGAVPVVRIGDIQNNRVQYETCLKVDNSEELKPYELKVNDIVIAMSGATTGKLAVICDNKQAYINQRVGIIRSKYNKFIRYCLDNESFMQYVALLSAGSAQPNISMGNILDYKIPYISEDEQQQIADYLDKKCGEIDRVVETEKSVIEKLKEYKQSIITEAVTKGLDKSVPLKDSGIEWIGKIPQHWDIGKLKNFTKCYDGKRTPIDSSQRISGSYPYWGAGSITDYINDYLFDEELILLGEDGAPFFDSSRPVAFLVNGKIWVNNHIHVLKPLENIYNKYMVYFLNSVDYGFYINGSILCKLTKNNMNNIFFIALSLAEQKQIADYLDKKCSEIEKVIADKEQLIEKLTEYKKSLIYECVTGKRKVVA